MNPVIDMLLSTVMKDVFIGTGMKLPWGCVIYCIILFASIVN